MNGQISDADDFKWLHSRHQVVRVKKSEAAFVYFILESQEGVTGFSTLDHLPGQQYRDIELAIPPDFESEVAQLLASLEDCFYDQDSICT